MNDLHTLINQCSFFKVFPVILRFKDGFNNMSSHVKTSNITKPNGRKLIIDKSSSVPMKLAYSFRDFSSFHKDNKVCFPWNCFDESIKYFRSERVINSTINYSFRIS